MAPTNTSGRAKSLLSAEVIAVLLHVNTVLLHVKMFITKNGNICIILSSQVVSLPLQEVANFVQQWTH